VADQLADGRRFRALTIMDVSTRESLAIAAGQRLKGEDVVATLNEIRRKRGVPKFLFCDNGSEFTSQIMDLWAYHNQVRIDFSRPGKPTDNALPGRAVARTGLRMMPTFPPLPLKVGSRSGAVSLRFRLPGAPRFLWEWTH
jgi:Integrase core domain